MSAEEVRELYDFAVPRVLAAGKIMLEAKVIKGEEKNGVEWDWVTEFDGQIEQVLIGQMRHRYPEHKFIGEESSSNAELTDAPTWIIDPIDGTENFIHKLRLSCLSLGVTIGKEQVFGIVFNPHMDELFTAIRGEGAFLNGERIHVSSQNDFRQSFFNYELGMARTSDYYYNLYMFRLKHLIPKVMSFRCLGCAALGLCYVACGRTDAYQCDGLHIWDAAAGTLIVREAGGYVVDSSGRDFELAKPNFLAASTKALADQYLRIEREADEEMSRALKVKEEFAP
ncbi:inositol monophosphatase 2 [Dendroctonus ponderosae]|uniref:Inositol-1-monophosphatase n=1 Tax=Dendroctonus ponderosae TaxID=77166 RepID=A0AAR5NZP5_DENPD|nr:inositol monophosphatase 2 [Dendroctonus ponderosae]